MADPAASSPCALRLRTWTGLVPLSAAPTASWSSRSGTIERTGTLVGDVIALDGPAIS